MQMMMTITTRYRFETFCYGPKSCKFYKQVIKMSTTALL